MIFPITPPEVDLADKLPTELMLDIISALREACDTVLEFQRNRLAMRSVCRSWSVLPSDIVAVDEAIAFGAFGEALKENSGFAIGIRKLEIAFGNTSGIATKVVGVLEEAISRCVGLQELILLGDSVESTASILEAVGRNQEIRLRRLVLDPLKHTYWIPFESLQGFVGRFHEVETKTDSGWCRLFSQSTFTSLELHGNSYLRESTTTTTVAPRPPTRLKELSISGSNSILVFTQVLQSSSSTLETFSLSGIRRDWRYNQYTMLRDSLAACGKNLRKLCITDHFCARSTTPYIEQLIPSLPLLESLTLGTTGYTAEIFPLLANLHSLQFLRISISTHLVGPLTPPSSPWPFLNFLLDRPTSLRMIDIQDPIGQPRIVSRARGFERATWSLQARWERLSAAAREGERQVRLRPPESWQKVRTSQSSLQS